MRYIEKTWGVSSEDELFKLLKSHLEEGKSMTDIGKIYNTTQANVSRWCKKFNLVKLIKNLNNKKILEELYVEKKLNMAEIAKIYGITYQQVSNYLIKHSILKRSNSEIQIKASSKRPLSGFEFILNGKTFCSRGYVTKFKDHLS